MWVIVDFVYDCPHFVIDYLNTIYSLKFVKTEFIVVLLTRNSVKLQIKRCHINYCCYP